MEDIFFSIYFHSLVRNSDPEEENDTLLCVSVTTDTPD